MKRYTYFPQVFLAIVFNFSVLISWTAANGEFDYKCLLLYLTCIFWTLGYDTIYAYQDLKDDKKIGIKSLAIYLENNITFWIMVFYILFVCMFTFIGILNDFDKIFYFIVILYALIILNEFHKIKKSKSNNFMKIFKMNSWYGFFITIGLLFNYI